MQFECKPMLNPTTWFSGNSSRCKAIRFIIEVLQRSNTILDLFMESRFYCKNIKHWCRNWVWNIPGFQASGLRASWAFQYFRPGPLSWAFGLAIFQARTFSGLNAPLRPSSISDPGLFLGPLFISKAKIPRNFIVQPDPLQESCTSSQAGLAACVQIL